jgi:uncharacterized protein YegL
MHNIQYKMDCDFLINDSTADFIPCAIRIKAPQNVDKIPTHIILLLDVSDSMQFDDKLDNVKRCCELILDFLNENDRLSLITFGETANLYLNSVPVSDLQKQSIRDVVKRLFVHGCTNLSAGLAHVREVCETSTNEGLKTGLLLLTDGHANKGVNKPEDLIGIFGSLKSSFQNLSIHCVAYGIDHNAELLKTIAENCNGSYNIVNTIEDTAFAFGDTLGGLMSCAFQNVVIKVPEESKVHGPHLTKIVDGKKEILIGDVYSGTKPLILFDIPTNQRQELSIQGSTLPSLEKFTFTPIYQTIPEGTREMDIELTRHRYTCTELLKGIGKWYTLDEHQQVELSEKILAFEKAINDTYYDGNSVAKLLRNEVHVLKQVRENDNSANLNQHITSIGLARGFSTPMRPIRAMRMGAMRHREAPLPDEETNHNAELETTFQNEFQSRIASVMRSASQTQNPC